MLSAMQFRDFIWPNNPHSYSIRYTRKTAALKYPGGTYCLQNLGRSYRIMEGEGEFFGKDAYQTFGRLANEFYSGGCGLLRHPVWQAAQALFVSLELTQKPMDDYVAYRFVFYELPGAAQDAQAAQTEETAALLPGQTLWSFCSARGLSMEALLRVNPELSNPSEVEEGRTVRLP